MTPPTDEGGKVADLDAQRKRQERDEAEREGTAPEHPLPGEDPDDQAEDEPIAQLTIHGDAELSHTIGGKKPTDSVIVIRGGQVPVLGPNGKPQQFTKGARVAFIVEGFVDKISEKDHRDQKTGDVVKTTKTHELRLDTIRRIAAGMVERIEVPEADAA